MVKLQSTGKQYNITIPKEHIKKLKWKKGTKLYISKHPDKDILYIEKLDNEDYAQSKNSKGGDER